MKKLLALTTALVLFAAAPAAAQLGIGAHAGISVPLGDYGATDANDGGFAELGFSGGVDLWMPLMMVPGLSWYTSLDAIAHSTDDAAPGVATDDGYLYFPIMTGLRFDIPAAPLGLFVTGQVGAVLARPPGADFGSGEVDGDITTKFGFSLGAGVQLAPFVYGGLKFYPMGDVDWSWDDDAVTETRSVSFFDVYVGIGVN